MRLVLRPTVVRTTRCGVPATLLTAVVLLAAGCADQGGTACTLIGAEEGVAVDVPRALYDDAARARVRVCDDRGCATSVRQLEPWPPLPRPLATFPELGRDFRQGEVRVTVVLEGPAGRPVARREQDLRLTPSYPNGRGCDGDGYLQGSMRLTPADRV